MEKYRQQWIVPCVLIVAGIGGVSLILWGIWALFFSCDADDTYLLHTLTTQQGHVVEIRRDCSGEVSETIYAKVLKNGQTIFPLKFLGRTGGGARFSLIEKGEQQQIVAIIEKATSSIVLAIYDLHTHEAAIYASALEEDQEYRSQLLQRINDHTKGKLFTWPDGADKRDRLRMRIGI